jgi:hypothetical protein
LQTKKPKVWEVSVFGAPRPSFSVTGERYTEAKYDDRDIHLSDHIVNFFDFLDCGLFHPEACRQAWSKNDRLGRCNDRRCDERTANDGSGNDAQCGVLYPTVILQMDQAEPEDQDLPRNLGECGAHADLGSPVRVFDTGVLAFLSKIGVSEQQILRLWLPIQEMRDNLTRQKGQSRIIAIRNPIPTEPILIIRPVLSPKLYFGKNHQPFE